MMELDQEDKILEVTEQLHDEKILEMDEVVLVDKMGDNFICNYANYEKILDNYYCFVTIYRKWNCLSADQQYLDRN